MRHHWPGVRLRAQIVKEFLSILRDPRARVILFVMPVVQLLIFSFAVMLDVKNATVVIFNQDSGRWGTELAASIGAASFVGTLHSARDAPGLHGWIERRQALLALHVPADFSRNIAAGRAAPVQVIVDGRRANAGQIAFGYVQIIAQRIGAQARGHASGSADGGGEPVALRHWFNPALMTQWFVVPSLSALLSMILAVLLTALSIARERELGTFEQLLVSPATAMEIIVSKTIPALGIALLLSMCMAAVAVFGFGAPFTGSPVLLFLALLLFVLSIVGLGLMISSVAQTQQQAILGSFALLVPMVLLSGFATPVENMPLFLQRLAELDPLKHILVIVRGLFLKDLPLIDTLRNAWPLVPIAAVTLGLATLMVKRRLV
ncbi:MAG: ABC transporter permease [Burkholderiaceae bacterium]|jgi:ABC-2 type transport system permease protein|nr:ABC transporter permease [Burkholderiaceae bacterium]